MVSKVGGRRRGTTAGVSESAFIVGVADFFWTKPLSIEISTLK